MKNQHGYTIFELLFVIVSIFGVIGWFLNVYKLFGMTLTPITLELIIRIIGVFSPVGCVVGYL